MNELYPLKFNPIILDKMWGGSKLKHILNKPTDSGKAGESWEISGVEGNISVVSNGFLEGNNLEELVEVYMGDIVGNRIFDRFGRQFPLLIKFIDACDVLSIQVHPNDNLARERHNTFGKTEMWYIVQADPGSELIVGFNRQVNKDIYLRHLADKKLTNILNNEPVKEGDVFFLPAGRIHAIGSGILLAEIQQTSDVTYRIYDFDRRDDNGNYRELHTDLAIDAIDYTYYKNYRTEYTIETNNPSEIVRCGYFTVNLLHTSAVFNKDIAQLDSFIVYMCLEGSGTIISPGNEKVPLRKGESILIPASLVQFSIHPSETMKLLEVYIG